MRSFTSSIRPFTSSIRPPTASMRKDTVSIFAERPEYEWCIHAPKPTSKIAGGTYGRMYSLSQSFMTRRSVLCLFMRTLRDCDGITRCASSPSSALCPVGLIPQDGAAQAGRHLYQKIRRKTEKVKENRKIFLRVADFLSACGVRGWHPPHHGTQRLPAAHDRASGGRGVGGISGESNKPGDRCV